MIKAAIDVGSNSVLLLVEQYQDGKWHVIHENTYITALGKHTKQTGLLQEESVKDTLKALKQAFSEARHHGANEILAGVTMAARIAKNADDFLERAKNQATPIQILTGDQEAELGFFATAADPLFSKHPILTTIDIGAQSTEIVTGRQNNHSWEILFKKSYPVGALGLRADILSSESPDLLARKHAANEMDEFFAFPYQGKDAGTAVTLGATGTNLISIFKKMTIWQPSLVHGVYLSEDQLKQMIMTLFNLTDAGRSALVGIEPGREFTLHIGALILNQILYKLHIQGCLVSVRGWRHAFLEMPNL